jgi:hypothetical protein
MSGNQNSMCMKFYRREADSCNLHNFIHFFLLVPFQLDDSDELGFKCNRFDCLIKL